MAIDLGATWTRVAVVRRSGRVLALNRWRTPKTATKITDLIKAQLVKLHREGLDRRADVGIAAIGLLSVKKGMILKAPNLGRIKIPIVDAVKSVHAGEVRLVNDCNAAVVGEKFLGVGRGVDNLAYVTISTGIGGGAIVDGHLLWGKDGNAAEIGHIVVDYKSPIKCGCGGYGHWEAMCSGVGIRKLAKHTYDKVPWDSPNEILDACLRNDRRAKNLVEVVSRLNAAGLASVINAYDPYIVSVGGGLGLSHNHLLVRLAKKYIRRYETVKAKITPTPLGEMAPLLGAAMVMAHPELV